MRNIKYTLKIRNNENEFENFDNIERDECCKIITEKMKEYHNIDYPMKKCKFFNIVHCNKRPINPLLKYFLTVQKMEK